MRERQVLVFDGVDLTAVLAALRPGGWVNLQPEADAEAEAEAPSRGYFSAFGARGPGVPFCTWIPADHAAGIQHGTGPKVARRIELPAGWRVTQDHPRRGLVVKVPPDVADEVVLRWLITAGALLSTVTLLGRWVAEVHG